MIDTHCHLTDPRLGRDLAAVLAEGVSAGVSRLVTIGTSQADSAASIVVCRQNAGVRCAVGVHPGSVARDPSAMPDATVLAHLAADPAVVAVGEIGLDYHYPMDADARIRQHEALALQLDVAGRLGKPVVIHCREAVDDTLAALAGCPGVRAVFHCFTGTPAEAERIVAAGYLLGFTGAVTYKPNDSLREVARWVPAHQYLIETDAPYLSPEPLRKHKTCRPAFVVHTAAAVAAARGVDVETVDRQTTANADALFGGAWPAR